MTKTYIDKHGKKKYCGGKDLKASQHYPREFGIAIRKVTLKHAPTIKANMARLKKAAAQSGTRAFASDHWADAHLNEVCAYLMQT